MTLSLIKHMIYYLLNYLSDQLIPHSFSFSPSLFLLSIYYYYHKIYLLYLYFYQLIISNNIFYILSMLIVVSIIHLFINNYKNVLIKNCSYGKYISITLNIM